jgi:hypothetical protein
MNVCRETRPTMRVSPEGAQDISPGRKPGVWSFYIFTRQQRLLSHEMWVEYLNELPCLGTR